MDVSGPGSPSEPAPVGDHVGLLGELVSDRLPALLARPVGLLAQAVGADPALAGAVRPVLDRRLRHLCDRAVAQASSDPGGQGLTSEMDLAAALTDLVQTCPPDPGLLPAILDAMPAFSSGSFRSLCLVLTQQAGTYYRGLAAADPAFLPNLAIALNNLSVRLAHIGSYGPAAAAAAEAADKFRRLVEVDRTGTFRPELNISLHNLSLWLTNLGRREEARAATAEVVAHYRSLAIEGPAVYLPRLAGAFRDLSVQLAGLGRHEEARAAATEAVTHFRGLVEADPARYAIVLGDSLQNLASRLIDLGLRKEAATRRAEADSLLRPRRRRGVAVLRRSPRR